MLHAFYILQKLVSTTTIILSLEYNLNNSENICSNYDLNVSKYTLKIFDIQLMAKADGSNLK